VFIKSHLCDEWYKRIKSTMWIASCADVCCALKNALPIIFSINYICVLMLAIISNCSKFFCNYFIYLCYIWRVVISYYIKVQNELHINICTLKWTSFYVKNICLNIFTFLF
jgi:hypothetical protein